jgi:hypothetical protein
MIAQHAYCPSCGHDAPVETPPCVDGHDDCPDRACLMCGAAIVVDPALPLTAGRMAPLYTAA